MKIRVGFVTNSSSTCFVLIHDGTLSEDDFVRSAGVDPSSPMASFFRKLYALVVDYSRPFNMQCFVEKTWGYDFPPELQERIEDSMGRDLYVFSGSLASDGSYLEQFFCMSSFELEGDNFYFNSICSYW